PAQLPPAVPDFTGRAAELAEVGRALRGPAPVVLHGAAGAGKSALAVQAAWRARRRFPDGQLTASLGASADPATVLTGFLRLLGHCAGLALAVRIAGVRLASRPNFRVAELAARLADDRRRLDELTAGDLGVRAVVTSALRERSGPEVSLLRLLAAFDGPVPD